MEILTKMKKMLHNNYNYIQHCEKKREQRNL